MSLFGFASDWSAVAAHALVAAVQQRIDWPALRPALFLPRLTILDVAIRAIEGLSAPAAAGTIELRFLTPMNAEGDDPLERPGTIFARLVRRVQGLARWHDAEIEADWPALARRWDGLPYDTGFLQRRRVLRRSGQQQRQYEIEAVTGTLRLTDVPPPLLASLAIGREIHVGKGASEGFGRFLLV